MESLKSLIKMKYKKIVIKNNDKELYVDMYTPRELFKKEDIQDGERLSGKTGIILLHGLGADPKIVYKMMRKGDLLDYMLFVPKISSITESNESHMLRKATEEINLFVKEAKKYCEHLFIFGHSLGGYLTAYTLQNATQKDVEGICLIGAPYSFKEVMFRLGLDLLKFVGKDIETMKPVIKQLEEEIPNLHYKGWERKLYFYNFKFNNLDGIRDLFTSPNLLDAQTPDVPIILIHGIEDEVVDYNQSVLLYQKLRKENEKVELHLIPFTGHHIKGMEKEAMTYVKEWMNRIIRGYSK